MFLGGFLLLAALLLAFLKWFARKKAAAIFFHSQEERECFEKEHPESSLAGKLLEHGLVGYRTVALTAADGTRLRAVYIPGENGSAVLLQHGYRMTCAEMAGIAAMLQRYGFTTLLLEVRAHGKSEGEKIGFGHHEMDDLRAGVDFLLEQPEVRNGKVGLLGNSMGGALCLLYAAGDERIKAVVAHSAYSSIEDTLRTSLRHFAGLSGMLMAPLIIHEAARYLAFDLDEIAPVKWVSRISPRPVFILMGGADTIVNPVCGEQLYKAAGEPRFLWYEPDLQHVAFDKNLPEAFESRVTAFFMQYLDVPVNS